MEYHEFLNLLYERYNVTIDDELISALTKLLVAARCEGESIGYDDGYESGHDHGFDEGLADGES
jgi:hypothetical protein